MQQNELCARHYRTGEPVELEWQDGLITNLRPADRPTASNTWLAPPLLDLQVNGFAGVDFQRDDLAAADLVAATRALRASGCARFLLTLVTDAWPKMVRRLTRL